MTGKPSTSPSSLPSPLATLAWFALLTFPAAIAAYYRTFAGFAEWDDEGTLMMMVRQYVDGSQLYREIFSGYGPVYFFFNGFWRHLTGIPVDHNSTRIATVVMSLVVTLICAWTVLRITQSLAAATVAHILVFRGLLFMTNEPGHPQELCMLLVVGVAACGVLGMHPRYGWLGMVIAGVCAAGLTLIKVNIGVFAIATIALALVFQMPTSMFWRLLRFAAAGAALVMPFMLMRVHMNDAAAQTFCLVVTLSWVGLLACAATAASRTAIALRDCLAASAGFVVAFGLCLLALTVQGVSLADAYRSLITNQLAMNVSPGFWYVPVELGRPWILWALAGAAAGIAARRGLPGPSGLIHAAFGATTLAVAVAAPGNLLGFATPFCWLLLRPPVADRYDHARLILAAGAVVQTLAAYPMPGSQAYFLRIPLIMVGVVVLADGVSALRQSSSFSVPIRPFVQPALSAVLAAVALLYPLLAYRANRQYADLVSLNLPGADRIHVEPELAADYRWMATQLRENCDTFISLPGLPSLYFWTGKPMPGRKDQLPGPLNMEQWMDLFTPEQQQNIAADFARHPNACGIYHPTGVDFWNTGHHHISDWPLAAYLMANFKPVAQSGDYQFLIRKERELAIPDGLRRKVEVQRRR